MLKVIKIDWIDSMRVSGKNVQLINQENGLKIIGLRYEETSWKFDIFKHSWNIFWVKVCKTLLNIKHSLYSMSI